MNENVASVGCARHWGATGVGSGSNLRQQEAAAKPANATLA